MSVLARIKDAETLWLNGRLEGAAIQVLIAVAATVRKRYPLPMKDNDAYKQFVLDELVKITNGPTKGVEFYFRGDPRCPVEDIIYNFIRCPLVHEGQLPSDIVLTQPIAGDENSYGKSPDGTPYDGKLLNRLVLNDVLGFPIGWIWNLIRVVAEAPENKGEFADGLYPLPNGYTVSAGLQLSYPDEHPERFPPNTPTKQSKQAPSNMKPLSTDKTK